jgi:hypothetical protein
MIAMLSCSDITSIVLRGRACLPPPLKELNLYWFVDAPDDDDDDDDDTDSDSDTCTAANMRSTIRTVLVVIVIFFIIIVVNVVMLERSKGWC